MSGNGNVNVNVGANLIRIHKVITRAINVATNESRKFAKSGFASHAERDGFVMYVRCLVRALSGHHTTEDEAVFPLFCTRLPGAPYDALTAEHERMIPYLHKITHALETIQARDHAADALTDLSRLLFELDEIWHPHIAKEEQHFSLAALAQVFSPDEHAQHLAQLGESGRKHSEPAEELMPFVLFNLEPDERAEVAQMIPAVITQQLIPVDWKARWEPMKPFLLI